MFESALFESSGKLKTKSRYWSLVTLILNLAVVAGLIIWPLLHTLALPSEMTATLLIAPAPPPPPPPPPPPAAPHVEVHTETLSNALQAPSRIPKKIERVVESAPPQMGVEGMQGMSGGSGSGAMGGILSGLGKAPTVVAAPPKKLAISSGVMTGMLLEKTVPQYPAIAKAARISGTVVLQATISKEGTITGLRVVSGPPMLQQAALSAVRTWRYKPYLLNGQPVEVETTVDVVFNLGD